MGIFYALYYISYPAMTKYDVTLLTDSRYKNPREINWYIQNILDDDSLVTGALEKRGLKVARTNWDDPDFDWEDTRYAVFRTTWDYFDRFGEFSGWLDMIKTKTKLINPVDIIRWNIDKHYLLDLQNSGINIPPTIFMETGDGRSLKQITENTGWDEFILKPAVSGAARHTYRLNPENVNKHEKIFRQLIQSESMLLQEFQKNIFSKGEVSFMLFGGKFSHAVLKKAKEGDFRVQDDFGGTLHEYNAAEEDIRFAEKAVNVCSSLPAYARVDAAWDNNGGLCVMELELIEPELWFRRYPPSADMFADVLIKIIK